MGCTALISFPSTHFCWVLCACVRNKEKEEEWEEDGREALFPIKCMEILGVYALSRRGPLAVPPHSPLLAGTSFHRKAAALCIFKGQ